MRVRRWVHVLTTRYTFVNTLQLLGRDARLDTSTQITLAIHARELGLPTGPLFAQRGANATGQPALEEASQTASKLDATVLGGESGLSHRGTHP